MKDYMKFLETKKTAHIASGFDCDDLSDVLFDFQKVIVKWSLKRGRSAIFADTGLGKTLMQVEWANKVHDHTKGKVLILAPLCVAHQTKELAFEMLGVNIHYTRSQDDLIDGINIANYEMLEHFDCSQFSGVVLDESSILKSYMGKTKQLLVESCRNVPFKLACSATPSPNDHLELGNHAEFLGIMRSNEMIMRFFINDTMSAGSYRLKNHARERFWEWVAEWAMCVSKPSDLGFDDAGYDLPALKVNWIEVNVELEAQEGELFRNVEINATSIHKERRLTAEARSLELARIANESQDPFLMWCNTNYEADELNQVVNDSVECRGSDSIDKKEDYLTGFSHGKYRVMITKPSIAGFGMNWQHCNNMAFVGLSYSYEDYYQAIRRCWRFGQKREVNVYIACSESERGVIDIIKEKEKRHNEMKKEMVSMISKFHGGKNLNELSYIEKRQGENWELHNGDCVHVARMIDSGTIDFSIYSPPFSNLYIYSDSQFDMGNSANDSEFFDHYGYLVEELYRITRPGRLTAIHCKDLPMYKGRDGSAGLKDFPGDVIRLYESKGWIFHSRVTIWKDPVIEMQRTKNHGLLYKQLCKDSAASRQGMADYMIIMRKWGDEEQWEPVTRNGERFFDYIGSTEHRPTADDLRRARTDEERIRLNSIAVWQRYASPVWFDIQQTNVLNHKLARDGNDEKHICPLQLDVIERSVELWSNPGELVFSPFTGIGSEAVVSLKMGRKFVGAELKPGYFEIAVDNINTFEISQRQESLFGE